MKIQPRNDEVQLSDPEIQAVLKAHIEKETGRAVVGSVKIRVDTSLYQVGDPRNEIYTAVCELKPEG